MHTKLLILGDSISLGVAELRGNEVVEHVEPSYVQLLREELTDVEIVVDAGAHRTTTNACRLIDTLLATHRPAVVLVMLGGNDGDIDWRRFVLSDGAVIRSKNTVEAYDQNLRQLAGRIMTAGAIPVLTDMPNHDFKLRGPYVSAVTGRDVTGMLERSGGQAASDLLRSRYRQAGDTIAVELGITLVQYNEALQRYPAREMAGVDGAHPSRAGHRVIASALLPDLSRLCRSNRQPVAMSV